MAKSAKRKIVAKALDPVLLGTYKRVLSSQFIATVSLVGLMTVSLLASLTIRNGNPPLLILVMATGMMGALFSALIRTYGVTELSFKVISPLVSHLDVKHLLMHSFIPLLIG